MTKSKRGDRSTAGAGALRRLGGPTLAALALLAVAAGCEMRPSINSSAEPAMNRTTKEFRADSLTRFPYKSDVPSGGPLLGAAQVDYQLDVIDVANFSGTDWIDVEVWVNRSYVVWVPSIATGDARRFNFRMIYNEQGEYFPLDNMTTRVELVEILMNGQMYSLPIKLP